MHIKYFGLDDDFIIDKRFSDSNYIPSLVLENQEKILDNYLNPDLLRDKNGSDFYFPKETKLDDDLDLVISGIYEYGIVYNIFNTNTSNTGNNETSAKLVVASNNASFFIDGISDYYADNLINKLSLHSNLKVEEVFIGALGQELSFDKIYGTRSKNKIVRLMDNKQMETEKRVIEYAIKSSMRIISESLEDNKRMLTKTRS